MKASDVAKLLMKTPDADVLIRVGNDWCECFGVSLIGENNNAVSLRAVSVHLGGVIIVDPDITPLNPG